MKDIVFTVTVAVRHESGKFATRDEIVEHIREQLEQTDVDVSGVGPDGDSEYVVDDYTVALA